MTDYACDSQGIRYGTLSVPMDRRREPTPKDFADPRFEVIWELIKRVDVDYRTGTFAGATGNDVCAVLDALDAAQQPRPVSAHATTMCPAGHGPMTYDIGTGYLHCRCGAKATTHGNIIVDPDPVETKRG